MEAVFLVILAVGFAAAGIAKLVGVPQTRDNFERWAVPAWSRPIVGAIVIHAMAGDKPKEVAPAIVLLIAAFGLLITQQT